MKQLYFLCFCLLLITYNSKAQILFEDQSSILGLNDHTGTIGDGYGTSFADFDDDGWDDITLASGPNVPLRFYKNFGGFFVEQSLSIESITYGVRSVYWVDYDNDGDKDLYVVSDTANGSRLYNRDSNDVFTNVTVTAGLPTDNLDTHSVAWGDIDNDGCLEMYMSNRTENSPILNLLFKNNCDGTFSDITLAAGVQSTSALTYVSGFFDFNNDGLQDLFVTNDKTSPNFLYKNNGDGTFTDVSVSSGMDIIIDSMSVTVDDFNEDGFFDIFITNTPSNVATMTTDGSILLRNNGDETFTDIAIPSGTELNSWCWGANFIDAENDGDLDIYVSCSYITVDGYPSYGFFDNQGAETFSSSTNAGFLNNEFRSYGNAIGDIDNDGRVDIVAINNFENNPSIWKNETTNSNNYLVVTLEGTTSNKDGIGSVIEIQVNGQKQYRTILNGESYLSQNSFKEFFGLGTESVIDYVKVKWLSGIEDTVFNVPANQTLNIVEGSSLSIDDFDLQTNLWPNPSINEVTISANKSFSDLEVYDSRGKLMIKKTVNDSSYTLKTSQLSRGVYLLKIVGSHFSNTEKLIIL